jgi:hypothetical protein
MANRTIPGAYALGLAIAIVVTQACTTFGAGGPSRAARARVEQLVGPLSLRNAPLREALMTISNGARLPVAIAVCASLAETPVTIVTTAHQQLGVLVTAAAVQVGAPIRLFVGQHGETPRPTLFCPEPSGELTLILRVD